MNASATRLLILALLIRGLIPIGYMPAELVAGAGLLQLCPGYGWFMPPAPDASQSVTHHGHSGSGPETPNTGHDGSGSQGQNCPLPALNPPASVNTAPTYPQLALLPAFNPSPKPTQRVRAAALRIRAPRGPPDIS